MTHTFDPAPGRRGSTGPGRRALVREFAVAGLIVTIAVVPLLGSPRVPPGLERTYCVRVLDLPGPLHLTINCDSPEFLILAKDPRLLVGPPEYRQRQGRPLYPVVGWLLALPFRAVGFSALGNRLPAGAAGTTHGGISYGDYLPEYMAYLLFNWLLLVGSVMLVRRLVGTDSYFAPRMRLPIAVLLVNQVTKAFFWTPHLQIVNVFISVASLALLVWMQTRPSAVTWRFSAALGLALGVASLVYGAFAVTVGAAVLYLFFRADERALSQRLASAALQAGALLAGYATPLGAWTAFVIARTGSFYSREVVMYRQFVWIGDSWARGPQALATDLLRNLGTYATTVTVVAGFAAMTLAALRMIAYALRVTHEPGPSDVIIGRAIVWYLAANVTFFALMGYYETRLSWTIVPPLLVLMGYEIGELESALQGRAKTALIVCVTALAGCYAAYWLARAGPYS